MTLRALTSFIAWLSIAVSVSGCPTSGWQPPPEPGAGAGAGGTAGPDHGRQGFASYKEDLLDRLLADSPRLGRQVGLHQYDGKVADYSKAGIARSIGMLREANKSLSSFDVADLSEDEALDLAILESRIELALFDATERALHETNPGSYDELFSVSSYIDFDYAPIEKRAEKLVVHEEAALRQTSHVLDNLRPVLSRPIVETSIKIYKGYAEYLRGDVVKIVGGLGDAAFQRRFAEVNEALAKAAATIAERLEKEVLPRADTTSHVLGKQRFLAFVAAQEGRAMDLGEFKRMAEQDLATNRDAFRELAKTAKVSRPQASELLGAATELMNRSRAFVLEKGLVTLPSQERATLKETPPYMRWNAAFLNMPGAFDTAKQAFYYITLPDPSWPKKEQEEYIFAWGTLMATTVHEVYPGHFLQGLWLRRAPTRVQKIVESYSFVEGWAHYTEQLMVEQGFGKDDAQNHLGQLSDALLRNCRFVVSIGVHAEGMTLEVAAQRFQDDCHQDKATAREQAVRATFDPGYFAYTVGKLQILKLREELKAELGARFDLKRFHDELLAHGSPPVALIADRVKRALRR